MSASQKGRKRKSVHSVADTQDGLDVLAAVIRPSKHKKAARPARPAPKRMRKANAVLRREMRADLATWATSIDLPFKMSGRSNGPRFQAVVTFQLGLGLSLRLEVTTRDRKNEDDRPAVVPMASLTSGIKGVRRIQVGRDLGRHEDFTEALKASDRMSRAILTLRLQDLSALAEAMEPK